MREAGCADVGHVRLRGARVVRHRAIGFVTPHQRRQQIDRSLLNDRVTVYAAARDRHPRPWSAATRNWARIDVVRLPGLRLWWRVPAGPHNAASRS